MSFLIDDSPSLCSELPCFLFLSVPAINSGSSSTQDGGIMSTTVASGVYGSQLASGEPPLRSATYLGYIR